MTNDYAYFLQNVTELYKQHGPAFVAIKDECVLGVYTTLEEAVIETARSHELGTFIVQQCAESPESLIAHFAGNVA